jgi:hypothetical protein
MCSKQDYEAIAKILAGASKLPEDLGPVDTVEAITSALCSYFQDQSETFNQLRFVAAVGI